MLSPPAPDPLDALLSLWAELCERNGRRSLTGTRALAAGSPELRERLAGALTALGYPEACASPRALGATLRELRGRVDGQGRCLEKRRGDGGAAIWYVMPGRVAA